MIEAVGHEYYPDYFKCCQHLLRPDGLFAIQAITIADQMYDYARKNVDFIKRYIFPGGGLPSLTKMSDLATKHTDFNILFSEDIGIHYAKTLELWHERFLANKKSIKDLGFDDRFMRMWQFYLAYCEAGFRERLTGVSQIVFARPNYRQHIPAQKSTKTAQAEKEMEVCSL
jgi:cyclopropane-fatty-acyl-phospholipid synthase